MSHGPVKMWFISLQGHYEHVSGNRNCLTVTLWFDWLNYKYIACINWFVKIKNNIYLEYHPPIFPRKSKSFFWPWDWFWYPLKVKLRSYLIFYQKLRKFWPVRDFDPKVELKKTPKPKEILLQKTLVSGCRPRQQQLTDKTNPQVAVNKCVENKSIEGSFIF